LYVQATEFKPELGAYNWGIVFRPPPPPAPGQPAPPPPSSRPGGFLSAWDPVTETERWRIPMMNGGGTVTTAGNLVFAATGDGNFVALTADTGESLWSAKLAPGFANPITYMLDGKQYVSVLAGRAGNGRVYTFVLDGKEPIPAPDAPPPPPPPPAGTAPAAPANQNQQ